VARPVFWHEFRDGLHRTTRLAALVDEDWRAFLCISKIQIRLTRTDSLVIESEADDYDFPRSGNHLYPFYKFPTWKNNNHFSRLQSPDLGSQITLLKGRNHFLVISRLFGLLFARSWIHSSDQLKVC
jgi:hypothetical protein